MPMVRVVNHGSALLLTNGPSVKLPLERGAHHVDKDLLDQVFGNPRAKMLFDAQCVAGAPQAEGKSENVRLALMGEPELLTSLTTAAAKEAIALCDDRERLRKWAFADARAEIRKALHLRDRQLLPGQGVDASVDKGI